MLAELVRRLVDAYQAASMHQLLDTLVGEFEQRALARFPGCLQCIPDPAQHLLDAAPLRMNPLDSLRACYPPPRFIEFQFNRERPPRLPPRRHWFHLLKVDRASTKASARPGTAPGRARFFGAGQVPGPPLHAPGWWSSMFGT